MTDLLRGRRALVTGAGRGIGRAAAIRMATAGALVAVNDRDAKLCHALVDELAAMGFSAHAVPCDVTASEGPEQIVSETITALGGLDIVVNNAGIERRAMLAEHKAELWDEVLAVNLSAPFRLVRAALPHLMASDHAAVVNICSITVVGGVGQISYDASKGGLQTLTRSLAAELGRHGIRVNAVCPGFIETMMTTDEELRRIGDAGVARLPIRRWGRPEEVAAAILWLASDEASYVTGHSLFVDGGFSRR